VDIYTHYSYMVGAFLAGALGIHMAKKRNRSIGLWGTLCFWFGLLACLVLLCIGKDEQGAAQ
jgi:hypothetical protein